MSTIKDTYNKADEIRRKLDFFIHILMDKKVYVRTQCYFELPNTATLCSLQRLSDCLNTARL